MAKSCVEDLRKQVKSLSEKVEYLTKVLQSTEEGILELDDIHWNPCGRSFTDCRRDILDHIDLAVERVKKA